MPRDGQTSSALGKAITVLETVIDRTSPVSIGALAMWLGLPKQTVHRIVRQLVDEGLLERAPGSDGYTAGRRLRRCSTRHGADRQGRRWRWQRRRCVGSVSYTHLPLPTNREV